MRVFRLVWLAMVSGTAVLAGQHANEYEFSVFGAYTKYDAAFNLTNRIGGGARLGYMFSPWLEAEVDVLLQPEYTIAPSNGTIEPLIGGASLALNLLHGERNILYVLGGYSRLDFGASDPYRFTDGGFHGAIGDRLFLTHRLALRVEGRAIYTPSTKSTFTTSAVTHVVGSVGLSIFAPSRTKKAAPPPPPPPPHTPAAAPTPPPAPVAAAPLQDSDKDGVPDSLDACPNTPLGAKVDARGCPIDSDHDGVPDGIDKCPDTPAGAVVDANGCSVDSDHDGVPDGLDKCPDTPAGATVDGNGCPIDSDHDGVPDGIDKCPDTPRGAVVDANGCPIDSDHDGVPDGIDKCPNTPPGVPVDATGCPITKDSDGDGVPDNIDKCPNTPKGVPVDSTGCMILFQPAPATPARPGAPVRPPTLILRGVNFETGRSILTRESYAVLDQVAASLLANAAIRIEIAGYTDATGPVGANLRLSEARAAAVRAYLARKGVSPMRMLARGYGARSPIATNATPAGRAQNRRVELHKLP